MTPESVRQEWVEKAIRVVGPVFAAMAKGELKRSMPVQALEERLVEARSKSAHIEALGRSLCGIAP